MHGYVLYQYQDTNGIAYTILGSIPTTCTIITDQNQTLL